MRVQLWKKKPVISGTKEMFLCRGCWSCLAWGRIWCYLTLPDLPSLWGSTHYLHPHNHHQCCPSALSKKDYLQIKDYLLIHNRLYEQEEAQLKCNTPFSLQSGKKIHLTVGKTHFNSLHEDENIKNGYKYHENCPKATITSMKYRTPCLSSPTPFQSTPSSLSPQKDHSFMIS